MYPKFILENGNIIIGKVDKHKQLVSNPEKVNGGGWWKKDGDVMILSGSSFEFGSVGITDLKNAIREGKVYSNPSCQVSIADRHRFYFNIGSTTIDLHDEIEKENSSNAPTSTV